MSRLPSRQSTPWTVSPGASITVAKPGCTMAKRWLSRRAAPTASAVGQRRDIPAMSILAPKAKYRRMRRLQSHANSKASGEFHDDGVDRERIAFLDAKRLHHGVTLGAQHIFHLHRFHDAKRLAGLHFLARLHGDGLDEAGHRAAQGGARARRWLQRHHGGKLRLATRIDA